MGDQEAHLRAEIARQIADQFGSLAPYKLVQDFVRTGAVALAKKRKEK